MKFDKSIVKNYALFNYQGTALIGPWGVSYSANITSDATGIGQWSEEQFIKCIRTGKNKGLENGRPLLPPMPWQSYAQLNDTDLKSIFAYLQTVKPVENVVPAAKNLAEL
ncbi:Nicotinate dehydrogenase subunit B [compost metagenome]